MPKGIFLAYTNCVERQRDEEFNRWYTHTHLPDLLKAQGVVSARRFFNLNPGRGPSQYLALYEIESDDIAASIAEISAHARASFGEGRHVDFLTVGALHSFQEIEPESLQPLDVVDYPRTPR